MNPADQIDAVARAVTDRIAQASHVFTVEQDRLRRDLNVADGPGCAESSDRRLRETLQDAADAADTVTPRVLLPADRAGASPHIRARDA